jgi:Putative metallopeptidase
LREGAMMKSTLALVLASMFLVTATATTALAASKTYQVSIRYVPPENPAHQQIYQDLKERRALEKLQDFLSPFRLPRTLEISLAGCDGEDDAYYGDDAITICYEYVEKLWKNMPAKTTPAGIAPMDTVIGPFVDTSLHEFAHALFDMFNLPVLGRVEDAADQVAAYIYLQLGQAEARRLITGTAYAYLTDARSDDAPLTPKEFAEDFAEVHGMPQQRAYNVLCIAYGADTKLFGDFVTKGYLPKERAEVCEEEYEQVQDAYEELVTPHIDEALAKEIFNRTWLRKIPTEK